MSVLSDPERRVVLAAEFVLADCADRMRAFLNRKGVEFGERYEVGTGIVFYSSAWLDSWAWLQANSELLEDIPLEGGGFE